MITITRTESYYGCETCGSYIDIGLVVTRDGQEVLNLYEDGHFGGGDIDLSDPMLVSQKILEALGHTVHIEEISN